MNDKIMVFSGTAGRRLGQQVRNNLSIEHDEADVSRHRDGEIKIQLPDVRGTDVFIINPTHPPAENILEVALLNNAARLASAGRITNVFPYMGYLRQERKDRPRVPISAVVVCDLLSREADRILLFDMHAEAAMGFFRNIVPDHIYTSVIAVPYLATIMDDSFVIASTDVGGVSRARAYAHMLRKPFVVFSKQRAYDGQIDEESIIIIGKVKNKKILFVDDIIDTAGTIAANAKAADAAGALEQYVYAPHLLLSGDALERINQSPLTGIISTDSVCQDAARFEQQKARFTILPIAPLLAKVISNIHQGKSLGSFFLQ